MLWTDDNGHWTNSVRTARNGDYYDPSTKELYDYIESQTDKYDCWDAVDNEVYIQLADCCGLDRGDYSDTQEFMDACLKVIKEDAAEPKGK